MKMKEVGLVFGVVLLSMVTALELVCPKSTKVEWIPDEEDCSAFYMCFNGQHFKYVCPDNLLWDIKSRTCLPEDSIENKCDKPVPTPKPCSSGKFVREAHQGNCAKYYECTAYRSQGEVEPVLMECPYPLLFHTEKIRCEFPETVKCDGRLEPKDPCEYSSNQCGSGNCVPCHLSHASCKGSKDGLNAWKGKEWTPDFAVCKNERVVYTDQCGMDDKGAQKLFDPDKKECVEQIFLNLR